jgi:hypothetical protein
MPISGNENTIGISIAFIIMIVIMLWFIIGGKGQWWMKVPLIGFGVYISVVIWFAMNGLLGWATPSQLPDKFRVHWIVVEEPDDEENNGGIYVWADDISKKKEEEIKELSWADKYMKPYVLPLHNMTDNGPRVYKIPYNRELHKQSRDIQKFLMEGGVYRGTMKGEGLPGKGGQKGQGQGQGEGGEGRDGKGKGKGKGPGDMSQEQVPHFYQLPPPKFPPKNEFMSQPEPQRPESLWD